MHLSLRWNERPDLPTAVKMVRMWTVGLDFGGGVHLEKPGDSSLHFNAQERAWLPAPARFSAEGAASHSSWYFLAKEPEMYPFG